MDGGHNNMNSCKTIQHNNTSQCCGHAINAMFVIHVKFYVCFVHHIDGEVLKHHRKLNNSSLARQLYCIAIAVDFITFYRCLCLTLCFKPCFKVFFLISFQACFVFVVQTNWPFNTLVCPLQYAAVASMYHPICQAVLRFTLLVSCGEGMHGPFIFFYSLVPEARWLSSVLLSHANGWIISSSTPFMYGNTAWSGVATRCMVWAALF